MMKMGQIVQKFARRSQSGQSIVILALGFVALLGFVGIVTDVSLMYVRFSTLTRAVDAASIAAAGQVRRQVPFQSEVDANCPPGTSLSNPCKAAEDVAFSRSFGNVGVAARQFIEFYGLDPEMVLIDMCVTSSEDDGTGALQALPGLEDEFDELCVGPTGDFFERKLIKVTAQIDSPTVFMRLLGFPDVTLEASAISETAVLDVVLIMDVSESMLNQTTYESWAQAGYTHVYAPPDMGWDNYYLANATSPPPGGYQGFGIVANHNFALLTGFNDYTNPAYPNDPWFHFRGDLASQSSQMANSLLCDDDPGGYPDCDVDPDPGVTFWSPFEVEVFDYPGYTFQHETPELCRVQYWPYSDFIDVPVDLANLYSSLGRPWTALASTPSGLVPRWRGFVPNYNFYRCCNDPNVDGSFTDLLCEPFRQARDATEQFLKRIDFLRGDRVAFVTFDREAYLIRVDRDGDGPENIISHMIESEDVALNTLTQYIGVRSEPSFYEPTTVSGTRGSANWVTRMPWTYLPGTPDNEQWQHRSAALNPIHDYEVNANCPFYDAVLGWPLSPVNGPSSSQAGTFGLTYDSRIYPSLLNPAVFNGDPNGQLMYPRNNGVYPWETASGYGPFRSYDLWASCRGTNIGAALREASNALVDPQFSRQGDEGSVWVMVMLSDGAAGASDPVFNSNPVPNTSAATRPGDPDYPYDTTTSNRVEYGGLGLCPVGPAPSSPSNVGSPELTQFNETPWDFPYCSDEMPETRHFCFFDKPYPYLNVDGEQVRPYVDLGHGECNPQTYDVDDYARDWADWVGLAERPDGEVLSQLPTIFTIGFGFNFAPGTVCEGTSVARDEIADCLGEELLRYIADVGDNFQVDTDYQQALRTPNHDMTGMTNDDFGPRGECEEDNPNPAGAGSVGALVDPLPAGEDCGNYFNAPTSSELNRVFDEIASRMFTRLAQ